MRKGGVDRLSVHENVVLAVMERTAQTNMLGRVDGIKNQWRDCRHVRRGNKDPLLYMRVASTDQSIKCFKYRVLQGLDNTMKTRLGGGISLLTIAVAGSGGDT